VPALALQLGIEVEVDPSLVRGPAGNAEPCVELEQCGPGGVAGRAGHIAQQRTQVEAGSLLDERMTATRSAS